MTRFIGSIALVAAASGIAVAQKTGALLHRPDSARRALLAADTGAAARTAARSDTIFAALVFDPSLAAPSRSSAWTAGVVRASPATEARIQANLCDIVSAWCGVRGAASLMFAGRLNSDDEFTELADLDGLVGSARVQGSWTSNATGVGAFYALSGTFGRPSFAYRDSVTLGTRSAQHASYAAAVGGGRRWTSVSVYGGVRWEQSYRARTARDVCSPADVGPAGTTTCASMVLGAPTGTDRAVASVSGAWSVGGNGAARLTISHDLRHAVTGIDLPIWMMANPAGGLAGGVRLGYRTDSRDVSVALFVSQFKL